jgi:hypothetical protein
MTTPTHLLNLCRQVTVAYDTAGGKPLGDDFDALMTEFKVVLAAYTATPTPLIQSPITIESRLPPRR